MMVFITSLLREKKWQLFLLLTLSILVYWKGLHYFFVGDDYGWLKFASVTDNCFKYFNPFYKPLWYRTKFFRPVPLMFFCNIYHAFRMNPAPYHVFMLLVHLFNIVLCYNFVHMISKHKTYAFITCLIFAFHFEHFMGVLGIANIPSMVNAFFILLTLIYWYRFLQSRKGIFYVGALVSFVFSIFSKEMSVFFLSVIMMSLELISDPQKKYRDIIHKKFWGKYVLFGLAIFLYLVNYVIYRYPFSYGYSFHFNGIDQAATILRMLQLMLIGTYNPKLLKAVTGFVFAVFLLFALVKNRDFRKTKDRLLWIGGIWMVTPTVLISVYSAAKLHYCYLMSIGLGLVVSSFVTGFFLKKRGLIRKLVAILLFVLIVFWGLKINYNAEQRISGRWYQSLISQVMIYLPDVSENDKIMFVPERKESRFTYYGRINGVVNPLELSYGKKLDIKICFREDIDKDPDIMKNFTVFRIKSDIKREYIKVELYSKVWKE
ncbi:MAG: hypothetical protein U9R44_07705 [Candidatus Omnitrophota bacterium]|nr:hypothetical protein [Candidatus Omnitrophota bacterium]